MKFRYYYYILAFLLNACTVQYNIASHTETNIDIQGDKDSTISAMIAPYKIGIDSVMNEVLCISNLELTKGKPESLLGNFVCDLCLNRYHEIADICVLNSGGLRTTLPKGEITRGKIFELMPFDNELVVIELEKTDLIALLEYITKRGGEPFSGIKIIMNKDGNIIDYSCKQDKIRVLTSDYLANGGDNMSFFHGKQQKWTGEKVRDAIINYCIDKDTISSKLDNRLSIIE